MSNTMFVVTHKEPSCIKLPKSYKWLSVNKDVKNADFYDSDGVEISDLNSCFCELTALYWMRKNSDCDNFGLCHYRRFFVRRNSSIEIANTEDLDTVLKNYDIVLPKKAVFNYSLKINYTNSHYFNDLKKAIKVINKLYPDYKEDVKKVLDSNLLFSFNMFYSSKKLIDEYCNWLFSIMFTLVKKINYQNYSSYQRRVFGFLSERLFTIWIIHNRLKVYEMDVALCENGFLNLIDFDSFMKRNKIKEYFKYIFNRTFGRNLRDPNR